MKHLLFASAAALLVTACNTMPPGEPYPPPNYPGDAYPPSPYPPGQGYPAPAPYPPDPYPQGPGYPAPAPYPPAPYPSAPDLTCPLSSSRDWKAWVNMMPGPGARPTLNVSGKAMTATGGYQVSFDPSLQIRRGYPVQAFATLRIFPPPAGATQAVVVHELRGQWPLGQRIDSVEIRCGEQTLATIAPVETAH